MDPELSKIEQDKKTREFFCLSFPMKLHQILEDAETQGFTSTISWMDGGESFAIGDKDRLENEIMPRYFMSGKFKSFQRSLNLWGFTCERRDGEQIRIMGSRRHHPLFQRGKPHLCQRMRRIRVKKPGTRNLNTKKERDPSPVRLKKSRSSQAILEKASATEKTAPTTTRSLSSREEPLSGPSPFIRQMNSFTLEAHTSPSSNLRSDSRQALGIHILPVGRLVMPSSTHWQSLTRIPEDMILRYLVASFHVHAP
jgi:hypothetical protein